MDHTDPTIEEFTEHVIRLLLRGGARHELRIIRAKGSRYLAYCPCGGFVLEAVSLDVLSWFYRKHINDRSSADLPTCPECAEVVHDADCRLVGDGRPVDGDAPDA